MSNISNLLDVYYGLTFIQKFEIATEIVEYYRNKKEYNKSEDENIIIINIFIKKLSQYKNHVFLKKVKKLLQVDKDKAFSEISNIIGPFIKDENNKDKICCQKGHRFSHWEQENWFTTEVDYNAGLNGYIDVEHTLLWRSCLRCGYTQIIQKEPQRYVNTVPKDESNRKIYSIKHERTN